MIPHPQEIITEFELSSTILSLLVANSANRDVSNIKNTDDSDDNHIQVAKQAAQIDARNLPKRAFSHKGKEKGTDSNVRLNAVAADTQGHTRDDTQGKSKDTELVYAEQREVVQILVSIVRLWGVEQALVSMQTMILLLLVC